ncbi:RNA 2'-phosphotransferase [Providencia sp. Me31A]|uniref:RNA 2'-phosphotransferase n=1 Tax=Providencia sp. Me31A TaxID=3392637 RepID=UPI003D2B841F
MQVDTVKISKFLSYILRHKPESIALKLNQDGWVEIETLLAQANQHGKKLTRAVLEHIVATNDKKRFTISRDGTMIRAAQGHSSQQVNLDYSQQVPPEFLYHGTATRFLDSINQQGLIPGTRHHVHLSDDQKTAAKVGARHGKPVVLIIEAQKMAELGYHFYLSDNQVWLTKDVPIEFIKQ